jgi:UDP-N-acetylglucosamine:LPS N-acetylglucosamine transferase
VADLLARARVLVTQFSTAAFEALAAGIPVVTVNLSPEPDVYPFAAEGAALGVYQAEEMLPQLQRALSHQPTRERLRETGRQFYARHMGPAEPVRPEWERIIANAEVRMQNAE